MPKVSPAASAPAHDAAEPTGAGVIGPYADRHAGEEWQCEDGEREKQPAEKADGRDAEEDADEDHDGGLREKISDGRAFHHHHGADLSIAEDEQAVGAEIRLDFRSMGACAARIHGGKDRTRE